MNQQWASVSSPHQYHPTSRWAADQTEVSSFGHPCNRPHLAYAWGGIGLIARPQMQSLGAPTADYPCGEGWQFFGSVFYELFKVQ